MKEDLIQIEIPGFSEKKDDSVKVILTEVFQDPTPLADIKKGIYIHKPLPEEVKKGRSHLIDGMISNTNSENGEISIKEQEISEITKVPVETRVSLSFDRDETGVVSCSRALTNFDREVIDAVSTLAPNFQIMTSATIYRLITGKDESTQVNQSQKKRVEESMKRCARCQVTIDITSELAAQPGFQDRVGEELRFTGNAINYESIEHQVGRGSTIYYKINSMPPFYRFAEKLGKVSIFPLRLLDSPVAKTDNIIAVQSYLLREIDSMKRDDEKEKVIAWGVIYEMATQEGKSETRQEKKRTRDTVQRILDYWIDEDYIIGYEAKPRQNFIELIL